MSDPVVLFSNGIPVSPSELDFGSLSDRDRINRLSNFSQMVNDIPAANSKAWLPSGAKTWDIYQNVLQFAQFPESSGDPGLFAASRGGPTGRVAALAGPANALRGAALLDASVAEPDADLNINWAAATARLGQSLRDEGFHFKALNVAPTPEPVKVAGFALDRAAALASVSRVRPAQASGLAVGLAASVGGGGLASLFLTQLAKMQSSQLTDTTLGTQFYPTTFFPADFYQSAYDSSWQPFELTPQNGDVWLPVPAGGKITGEMLTVQLQRPWWSTWVFANRGWRFNPEMGMEPLSDGGNPPTGTMPLFSSALLIARNVKTVAPASAFAQAPIPAPFTLAPHVIPAATGSPVPPSSPIAGGNSMMIFGFVCTVLGVSPNPNPALHWPQ